MNEYGSKPDEQKIKKANTEPVICPIPQLASLATTCDCAHSDRHRATDWAKIEQLTIDNKQLKHALGHTQAALDDWGDGTLGELREKLADMQAENKKLNIAWNELVDKDDYKATLIKKYETAMGRCIKAMQGSNCLELEWLEQAVK